MNASQILTLEGESAITNWMRQLHSQGIPNRHMSAPDLSATMAFPLDRNHLGIRLVVLLTLLVAGMVGLFLVMPAVLAITGTGQLPVFCLRAVGAGFIGMGAAWAMERALLSVWPSGRVLEIRGQTISLRERSGGHVTLESAQPTEILSWFFVVPRDRSSVRKGWYCVACAISQGGNLIVPYAFVGPDDAKALPQWPAFVHLTSHAERSEQAGELLRADEGPLREAERDRWESGVEMLPEHFVQFVAALDALYPDWPPKKA